MDLAAPCPGRGSRPGDRGTPAAFHRIAGRRTPGSLARSRRRACPGGVRRSRGHARLPLRLAGGGRRGRLCLPGRAAGQRCDGIHPRPCRARAPLRGGGGCLRAGAGQRRAGRVAGDLAPCRRGDRERRLARDQAGARLAQPGRLPVTGRRRHADPPLPDGCRLADPIPSGPGGAGGRRGAGRSADGPWVCDQISARGTGRGAGGGSRRRGTGGGRRGRVVRAWPLDDRSLLASPDDRSPVGRRRLVRRRGRDHGRWGHRLGRRSDRLVAGASHGTNRHRLGPAGIGRRMESPASIGRTR